MKEPFKFADLKGLTLEAIEGAEKGSYCIKLFAVGGRIFEMYHDQDCCENVSVEDICGDINDLIGSPIVLANEDSNGVEPPALGELGESFTWTFYNIATVKGHVTIRWYGTSTGYYSESVDVHETTKGENGKEPNA
jgi:hypothetical protein